MRRFVALSLSLSVLTGCTAIHKALFEKDVAELPVQSLELQTSNAVPLCPGAAVPLIVVATLEDGKQERTTGAGDGALSWDGFTLTGKGTQAVGEGYVQLHTEPSRFVFEPATVQVHMKKKPAMSASIPINTTLACQYVGSFNGQSGRAGEEGKDGSDGTAGRSESSIGSQARAGGHGSSGGHGGTGRNGEAGRQGDVVSVELTMASISTAERPIVEVRAFSNVDNQRHVFLVDPSGGRVTISARGGNGGRGGRGGEGGQGGKGGTGAPAGNGGDGGNGGEGGDGADGGDGGQITVFYDAAAEPFLSVLELDNRGGNGGKGGAPGKAGSGGKAFSGGNSGRDGEKGSVTGREGRPGRDGRPPEYVQRPVSASAMSRPVVQ